MMSPTHPLPLRYDAYREPSSVYKSAFLALGLHVLALVGVISAAQFVSTLKLSEIVTIEVSFQAPSRAVAPVEKAPLPMKAKQVTRETEPKPSIAPVQESKPVFEQAVVRSVAPAAELVASAAPIEQKALPAVKTVEPIQAVAVVQKPAPSAVPKEPVMNVPAITPALFNAAYLNNPPPLYPAVSRLRNETGTTMLRVHISTEGQALAVDVSKSSGSGKLDQAAVNAVSKWRFVAAKRGGTAVDSWVTIPIEFNINQ